MDSHKIIAEIREAETLSVLLDYDGTLVPIALTPELAAPDDELLTLLSALANRPGTHLHIVSGRPRETLESWMGDLAASLWAEHGLWHRPRPGHPWEAEATVVFDWIATVYPLMEQFTACTPGAFIEVKSASLAWHYRRAPSEFGARQAQTLRVRLEETLADRSLDILAGKKVIEVRPRGVSKALVTRRILPSAGGFPAVLAVGDDRTDEDLFRALPDSSVSVAVGDGPIQAKYRVTDHHRVRAVLRALLTDALTNR